MNQKRPQSAKPTDVILMLGDGVLSESIENLLFEKKNLRTYSIAHCHDEDLLAKSRKKKKKVVVLDPIAYYQDSLKCLLSLLANPNVEEVIMVNTEDNLVQVLKKRQVLLTDKADFAKLF